ncbi:MAG: bifunctional precorrin-2 dehydrogenase/sirohydrochlorin ferrochelatase [Desulfobacteraceae bacterium]
MRYYPLFLDIRNRKCLVVGGGSVGTRKTETLVRCGAEVTVISRVFSKGFSGIGDDKKNPMLVCKDYEPSDLEGVFLVFAATSDRDLNERIRLDAEKQGKLYSIADDPNRSCFIAPSVVARGDLTIAVSTSGQSPALAKKLRQNLETLYGPEYADFLRIMGSFRKRILEKGHDPETHKDLFRQVIDRDVPSMIREGRNNDVRAVFQEVFGKEFDEGFFGDLKD